MTSYRVSITGQTMAKCYLFVKYTLHYSESKKAEKNINILIMSITITVKSCNTVIFYNTKIIRCYN